MQSRSRNIPASPEISSVGSIITVGTPQYRVTVECGVYDLAAAPRRNEVAGVTVLPTVMVSPTGPLVVPALEHTPEAMPELMPQAAPGQPRLSLVVPTLNERENIADFLAAVRHTLDEAIPGSYEVIVVDDDSPDRTWEIAAGLSSGFP